MDRDLVGYHKVTKMGFAWSAQGPNFQVRTKTKFKDPIGSRVFMVQGRPIAGSRRTRYFLLGYFWVSEILLVDNDELPYSVRGITGKRIEPVQIGGEEWFPARHHYYDHYTVERRTAHTLGMLWIDEIQNATEPHPVGREEMLSFFVDIQDNLAVPMGLIGTPVAAHVLICLHG